MQTCYINCVAVGVSMFKDSGSGRRRAGKGNLLTVKNYHAVSCGPVPDVDTSGKYVSYYENRFGEQFIFVGDPKAESAVVYGGDLGWDEARLITAYKPYPSFFMSEGERFWILSCLIGCFDISYDEACRRWNAHVSEVWRAAEREAKRREDAEKSS